jgi:cAMP-specific phosphodiesterase 4
MSRQKRIPPNKLLTTLDPSISSDKKALNGSFDTIDDDSNLDTVLKDVLGCKDPEARAIKSELSRLDDWSFSQFSFEVISKGNPLLVLGYHLLDSTGVIKALRLEPKKILNFLSDIQGRYHSQNPYHNRMHAADVLQATNYLGGSEGLAKHFSPMDRLILYIGSAIHDFDHPGVNNNFMINTASSQAILYNDKSVLENHHVAAAFIVYDSKGKNFLSHVSREEYKTFRSSVIDLVLSTDLSLHFSFVTLFKNKVRGIKCAV